MTARLHQDFVDFIDAVNDAGVRYVVVGAWALGAHGLSRTTGDIDFFIEPSNENAARMIRALLAFGAPLDMHGVTQADFEARGTLEAGRTGASG